MGDVLYFQKGNGTLRETVPYIAVGFRGWKTLEAVRDKVREVDLDGLLLINEGIFVSPRGEATGDYALLAFFVELHQLMNRMLFSLPNYYNYLPFEIVPAPGHSKTPG